jgi:chromosome segregation ATPase
MGRSTDTRFVIITHNPITMARMNRLYGVTMAERGISQLGLGRSEARGEDQGLRRAKRARYLDTA